MVQETEPRRRRLISNSFGCRVGDLARVSWNRRTNDPNSLSVVTLFLGLALPFLLASLPWLSSVWAVEPGQTEPRNETVRGRVVYLAEAMERLYGVKSVREASQRTLALETRTGELIPLIEDVRGRAFRADPRLLAMKDVELLVRRHPKAPAVQVVRLYTYRDGKRMEVDYWCEICAIALFELKPCDCCQGDIELRFRHMPGATKPAPAATP